MREFSLLLSELVELLERSEKALERMKRSMSFLVLQEPSSAKSSNQCVLIESSTYKEANTIDKLFEQLLQAKRLRWEEPSLLEHIIKASKCEPAMEKLKGFLLMRKRSSLYCYPSSQDHLSLTSAEESSPHSEAAGSSEKAEVPQQDTTNCQVGQSGQAPEEVEIEEKLDKDMLTAEEYDENADFLCGILAIPRYVMRFLGARGGCISIRWTVSRQLLAHMLNARITEDVLQSLAGLGVKEIRIGTYFHLSVPAAAYWEGKHNIEVCL